MTNTPHHEDIGTILKRYEIDKNVEQAYSFIGKELGNRGCFEKPLNDFSQEVRIFILTWYANNEINNGGFASFFYNGYGKNAEETVKSFKKVGAPIKAKTIEKTMNSFPKGKYPKSVEEYDELLEKHEDKLDFLNDEKLDSQYLESPEKIEELVVNFVKSNYTKFTP